MNIVPNRNIKTFFLCFSAPLVVFGFLSFFNYFCYVFFILLLCVFVISSLHFLFRFKKSILASLISIAILFLGFIAIPDFNFLLTYPARQTSVNHIIKTGVGDREFFNLFLGKVNSYIRPDQIEVYFSYYKGIRGITDRAFFVYTTKPERIESSQHGGIKLWKKLKNDWYFLLTKPDPD
ncbi:MAG TPA: hypothetical protein DEV81_06530 [Cyanobacteria bacterium UBA11049]|nr:hypothetical protein [Cyanobacteria bacterium UBA11049]